MNDECNIPRFLSPEPPSKRTSSRCNRSMSRSNRTQALVPKSPSLDHSTRHFPLIRSNQSHYPLTHGPRGVTNAALGIERGTTSLTTYVFSERISSGAASSQSLFGVDRVYSPDFSGGLSVFDLRGRGRRALFAVSSPDLLRTAQLDLRFCTFCVDVSELLFLLDLCYQKWSNEEFSPGQTGALKVLWGAASSSPCFH